MNTPKTLQMSLQFSEQLRRKIFGPNWEKVIGGWKKLHGEELNNCCEDNQFKENRDYCLLGYGAVKAGDRGSKHV